MILESHQIHSEKSLVLSLLDKLMAFPTGSKNHDGIRFAQRFIIEKARHHVDEVLEIPSEINNNPPLLILRVKGESPRRMAFIMHIDTVSNNTEYRIEDDKFIGAGCADNKASIALILTLLQSAKFKEITKFYTLDFIISPNEELGSLGHHKSFKYLSSDLDYAIGLEPSPKDGHIISSRNGNRWYDIHFSGISSHSGRLDDPSLNSCHEASLFIGKLIEHFSFSEDYRINVGHFSTNTSGFNTVPDSTSIKLDTRFKKHQYAGLIDEKINELLNKNTIRCHKTSQTSLKSFIIADDCPPMEMKPLASLDYEIFNNVFSKFEHTPLTFTHSGGAADINYFNARFALLDGLGPLGGKMHTKDEFMMISSLENRIFLLNDLIEKLGNARRDFYAFERNIT